MVDNLTTSGLKNDAEKTQWTYLPFAAVEEIVKVLEVGSNKYGCNNWKKGLEKYLITDISKPLPFLYLWTDLY